VPSSSLRAFLTLAKRRVRVTALLCLPLLTPTTTTFPPRNSPRQHHRQDCHTSSRSLPTQADHGLRLCDCLRRPHLCPFSASTTNEFSTCKTVQLSSRYRDQSTRPIELRKCDRLSPGLTTSRSLLHKPITTLLTSVRILMDSEPESTVTRPHHPEATST